MSVLRCGAAIVAILAAGAANASVFCAAYADMTTMLSSLYGEVKIAAAKSSGLKAELWANTESGTWTVLTISPLSTCAVRDGDEFVLITPPPVEPEGDPI